MKRVARILIQTGCAIAALAAFAGDSYVNFESSHVHPIALTPSGNRLLAVNTPDARLEVFTVAGDGSLTPEASIPVGLEPVSVVARTDGEAWVANHLSDTVSIVDLNQKTTKKTLFAGDEPTDIAFAAGKAFVAVSQEDAVKVFDLANLDNPPTKIDIFNEDVRALAVSTDGTKVYAVTLRSGNQTTVLNSNIMWSNTNNTDPLKQQQLGLNTMICTQFPHPYPPLPSGISRNPALTDPPDGKPKVGLIVRYDNVDTRWEDELGRNWNRCLPFRMPDRDLFIINASTLAVTPVSHLGTSIFDVSVNPANGKIYVPNTEARNMVRFEHPLGVEGHVVDNRLSIVDPAAGNAVTVVGLNSHINRSSDPNTNLSERQASISQPGMMVWKSDGSAAYMTAIGSRKLWKVSGSCLTPSCIFGPNRASPDAVEVGEGPTGVALHEAKSRLYVMNRFSNSIALVDLASFTKTGEVPLHDPSNDVTKQGRRLLYDGIDTSGHGDAACSSCHLSADMDGVAWDLGNPPGTLVPYGTPGDNVRFIQPTPPPPQDCDPAVCAGHDGFDPQKGPMTTQTLRAMVEPLHWRGDRPTMNDFNPAFVGLLGAKDIGPVNGKPAGLTASQMETLRQFTLGIAFPPNPFRNNDDTIPNSVVQIPGHSVAGNPTVGKNIFETFPSDAGSTCTGCHSSVMGTNGGKLGGIEPSDPPSLWGALVNGGSVQSIHSDMKIPHLRNLYERVGPIFGSHSGPLPDRKPGVGFTHDGSVPDLGTFFTSNIFSLSPQQIRDVTTFVFHFPTGTKPTVAKNLTFPAGTPPTGPPADEDLLNLLVSLGDRTDPNRHCELTATTFLSGRTRAYHLSGGVWITDVAGEPPLSTTALRSGASGPITFLCATIGSGPRLGGDRDEDLFLDGDDCSPADPGAWDPPQTVTSVTVTNDPQTVLSWTDQGPATGPGVHYDVAGGSLQALQGSGLAATSCVEGDVATPSYTDTRPDPASGDGYYYLIRAENSCGAGGFGTGRESLDPLDCSSP